jgi:hypothetical protein
MLDLMGKINLVNLINQNIIGLVSDVWFWVRCNAGLHYAKGNYASRRCGNDNTLSV